MLLLCSLNIEHDQLFIFLLHSSKLTFICAYYQTFNLLPKKKKLLITRLKLGQRLILNAFRE